MRNLVERARSFGGGAVVLAALILLPPARDLCGWTGEFDVGAVFLLALLGPLLTTGLMDGDLRAVAPGLKRMAAALPLGLAVLTALLAAGSFNLREISLAQAGGFARWFVFHDPFSALGLLIGLIALQGIFASRLARDGEDFVGLEWVNCVGTFVICALLTSVFLGAWYDPFGIVAHFETLSGAAGGERLWAFAVLANALGVAVFVAKVAGLVWVERFFRNHSPRYRLREIAGLCVEFLLPAAAFNFLAGAGYLWLVDPLPDFREGMRILLAVVVPLLVVTLAAAISLGRRKGRMAGRAEQASGDGAEDALLQ